ncbi:MAG: hypothetical protein OEZ65_04905 [Gemmatimonadota bacterium]|nr:hypothetical protein [Gemmatimonadota bacterium]MDH5758906.1 hypothetical protein [Gemmatimonadota bacterium]
MYRKVMPAVLFAAALALAPSNVEAQERGLAQAEISTAQAEAVAAWYNGRAGRRPSALPEGIRKKIAVGQPLPPGIRRTRVVEDIPEPPELIDGTDLLMVGEDLVLIDSTTLIVLDISFSIL